MPHRSDFSWLEIGTTEAQVSSTFGHGDNFRSKENITVTDHFSISSIYMSTEKNVYCEFHTKEHNEIYGMFLNR